jgi:hypothetical protein|tara:strand:+ start:461 stop:775 length:315 start_codon:yes stop_codon:yes gene_type:complete
MVNTIIQDQEIGGIDFPLVAKHLQVMPFAELLEPQLGAKLNLDDDKAEEEKASESEATADMPELNFESFDDSAKLRVNVSPKHQVDDADTTEENQSTSAEAQAS